MKRAKIDSGSPPKRPAVAPVSSRPVRAESLGPRSQPGNQGPGNRSFIKQPRYDLPEFLKIDGHEVRISNPNKVLYPETNFTKQDVVAYYRAIASTLLPHLRDRPLTLKRYPNGVAAGYFYEKQCPAHKPSWVKTASITGREKTIDYCIIDSLASLIWVANLASLELHTLLSHADTPQHPTSMVFDLDPGPDVDIRQSAAIALRLRDLLQDLGLKSFAKTSGGKGLHLWVPLNTPVTFDQTKEMSQALARILERDDPTRVTSNMRKDLRPGRVFIDWSQNDEHKTTVCAYSLRAMSRPTVSTPLEWTEVSAAARSSKPVAFTADQVLRRLKRHGDLFAPVLKLKQRLPA